MERAERDQDHDNWQTAGSQSAPSASGLLGQIIIKPASSTRWSGSDDSLDGTTNDPSSQTQLLTPVKVRLFYHFKRNPWGERGKKETNAVHFIHLLYFAIHIVPLLSTCI